MSSRASCKESTRFEAETMAEDILPLDPEAKRRQRCPKCLAPGARRLWREYVEEVDAAGLLTAKGYALLTGHCLAMEILRLLELGRIEEAKHVAVLFIAGTGRHLSAWGQRVMRSRQ